MNTLQLVTPTVIDLSHWNSDIHNVKHFCQGFSKMIIYIDILCKSSMAVSNEQMLKYAAYHW